MVFGLGYGYAQNTDSLIGLYWNGSAEVSTHVNLQTQSFQDADTIDGLQSLTLGEHCFDMINRRLFVRGNSGINVIDASTGELLDTFGRDWPITEMEYEFSSDRLIGLVYTDPLWTFVSIDVSAPTLVYHDTLADVYEVKGGATFDAGNRRYILKTNLGFTVISAQTSAIVDTIADPYPYGLNAIEFNHITGKIVGTYWDQGNQQQYFTELNPATKVYTTIAPINGITGVTALSTLDYHGQRYINLTSSGIMVIDVKTGALLDTFPNMPNCVVLEYINPKQPVSLRDMRAKKELTIYPNPAREQISLDGVEESGTYRIFDITGRELARGVWETLSPAIDISLLQQGMYWIYVGEGNAVPFVKE